MKVIYDKSYKVFFGESVLNHLAQTVINKEYSNVFVLVDDNTEKFCLPILKPYLENFTLIKIPSGEVNKNLQTANIIWNNLQQHSANRNAVLLNLGGGTLSDIGGFCAATFKRGIDFINIPTTLLSMVDAAIGGKQGLDLNNYKNLIGVFQHPKQIFIFPEFINTLPNNEKRNGLAEIIKHALIFDDKLFDKIISTSKIDSEQLDKWIEKSAKIKIKIINKDPFEKGLRKVLNFGHTIGHAVETFSLINDSEPLKHGEAVAIGIICEVTNIKGADDYHEFLFLAGINSLILIITFLLESNLLMRQEASKVVYYEKIELIHPDRNAELLSDLKARTGINIHRVSIQKIDFLRDSAQVRIYYYEH